MKRVIGLLLVSIAALLVAGCLGSSPLPAGEQTVSPAAVVTEPSVSQNLIPEPTDVIPPVYAVTVEVGKNTVSINPYISVSFRGGPGQEFTQTMIATVFRSDGITESGRAGYPQVGSEILLTGTTGNDRVAVDVTLVTGETYRVYDALVPFRNLNP
ncbi:MAG: hypothetical protein MUC66_09340 [Methanolinea sp.]|jgi:hypothetical protein|nr:hypothetical protein [Methanolinea sp.]